MEVLCSDIVPKLSSEARAFVAQSMYPSRVFGRLSEEEQKWFTSIFIVSTGDEITEIKNRIDFHGTYRATTGWLMSKVRGRAPLTSFPGKYKNLHKLVYKYLEGEEKEKLLHHFNLHQHQWPERHSSRSHKYVEATKEDLIFKGR